MSDPLASDCLADENRTPLYGWYINRYRLILPKSPEVQVAQVAQVTQVPTILRNLSNLRNLRNLIPSETGGRRRNDTSRYQKLRGAAFTLASS